MDDTRFTELSHKISELCKEAGYELAYVVVTLGDDEVGVVLPLAAGAREMVDLSAQVTMWMERKAQEEFQRKVMLN